MTPGSPEVDAAAPSSEDVDIDVAVEVEATDAAAEWRTEAAAWEHEAGLASAPLAARLVHQAARLQARAGDPEAAKRLFARALELDPTYRPALTSLRRLHADLGDWDAVAADDEAELRFAKDPATRFELLRAKASVLQRKANKPELAAAAFSQALQIAPEHPSLLRWAIGDAARRGDVAGETALHLRFAKGVRDDRTKARHLSQAAYLLEKAGDEAGAKAAREQLLAADPIDLEAQAAVLPELFAGGKLDAAIRVAKAEVDASSGSVTRVRLARLLLDHRKAIDEAAELLQGAREINPRDGLAIEAMVALAEAKGDEAALVAAITTRLETGRDALDKANATLRLARLAESKGRTDEAKALYAKVAELSPGHLEAVAATERILRATSTPEEKLARAEALAAAATEPMAKAEAGWRLANLLEGAGRIDDAVARLEAALEAAPGHAAVRSALFRLYESTGKQALLATALEREIAASEGVEDKRERLLELAILRETKLADAAGALVAYRTAFDLGSDDVSLAGVVRCATSAGNDAELAWALETAAQGTLMPAPEATQRARIAWLERAATIRRKAGDGDAALALHQAILALDPNHLASRAAVRERSGGDEAVPTLAEATTPGQLADVARAAWASGDEASAIAALVKLVEAVPNHPSAWNDLARLREKTGDFAGAVQALEAYAGLIGDKISKADKLYRAAELAEQRLADVALTERLGEATVATHPRHAAGWHLVTRLALARRDTARVITALEQEAAVTQLKDCLLAQRRLARILAERGGDRARALVILKDIAETDPSDLGALSDLELLLHETGDLVKSAELRGKLAARCGDVRAAAAMRTSAAEDRSEAGDLDGAVAEYRRALALDGRNRAAADEIIRVMRARGDRTGLLDTYQRIAPYQDNDSQAVLLLMRGELHEEDGQAPLAQRCYRDSVAADALMLPALRSARRLAEAAGEWNEARALLAAEGEAHADADEGVALLVRAGELAEKMREIEHAEAHYLRALEKIPGEARAMGRLDALLQPQGRFAELVTIYEREGEATEGSQSAGLYAEAAWIRYEKLGEDRRAAVPLNRALSRDPACLRAAELKATIALKEGRAAEAEEALSAALAAAPATHRTRLLLRLADARLAGGRGPEALEAAQAAAEADPSSLEAMELVARAALASKAFLVAVAMAEKLLGLAQDIVNGSRYAKLAGHVRRIAGDVEGASGFYRRALSLLPGDKEAIEGLEATHLDGKDYAGLAGAYEQLASASAATPGMALQYLGRAAAVWEKAADPVKAAAVWRSALKTEPTNTAVRLSLARTLAAAPTLRTEAAAELRGLIAQDPKQADAWRELAKLFESEGRRDAAFVARASMVALNLATPEEQAKHAELAPKAPTGPTAALAPEEVELLVHPVERASPVRDLLVPLQEVLSKVVAGNLDARGLGRGDRVKGDLRTTADRLAKVFGVGEFDFMQTAREPGRAWIENTVPPTIALGTVVLQGGPGEVLFTLGMMFGRLRSRTQAMFFAQPIEIANLTAELLRQIDPAFQRFGTRNEDLARVVAKNISRAEKKAVEAVLPRFAGAVNFGAFTQAMAWTSHRFGLVTAGDPTAAVSALARTFGVGLEKPEVRELVTFAISEEHLALRQKLKLALP